MNTKSLLLCLSAAMLLSLQACGNNNNSINKVPLEYDVPSELTIGTPVDLDVPNLETSPNHDPILVAKGHQLLSLNKPVTTSDPYPPLQGSLDWITNGEIDGNPGYSVILDSPGLQWIQIDLEDSYLIDAVVFWHFFSEDRVFHDVIVQVSNDEEFTTDVTTLFNNDHDNSSGLGTGTDKAFIGTNQGKQVPGNGVNARYVRLYSNGSTASRNNEYIQVQVFGRPIHTESDAESDADPDA